MVAGRHLQSGNAGLGNFDRGLLAADLRRPSALVDYHGRRQFGICQLCVVETINRSQESNQAAPGQRPKLVVLCRGLIELLGGAGDG